MNNELIQFLLKITDYGIGMISLLILFIFVVKTKKTNLKIDNLSENHLHEVKEALERIERKLDKLDEIKENLVVIKTKLNNK